MLARLLRIVALFAFALLGPGWSGVATNRGAAADAAPLPSKPAAEKARLPDWDKVVEGVKRLEGLFPLYYQEKEQRLFMEVRKDQYDKELILPIAIARGAGLAYLGGETLNFGDQWLISFRRAGDKLLVIRRNVRMRAESGTPQADAVNVSYTDSVLKALPIKSERPGGEVVLVDLADLFMSDLANLGFQPDPARSTWAKVKAFPKNVEIEVSAVFTLTPQMRTFFFDSEAVPDARGTQVVIHYGLSMLPATSYKPRLADDRVGHFLTAIKDFTRDVHETPSTRFVTRWHLEKEKPTAEKSPPKQPIIFWIERTIPREYRQYVRDGILEWNRAFERVGFIDAIQVRDQQTDDEFDPEDIRYNTIRWITTSAGFAMGPSRTNPKTGEILDADIIFDEGMIRYWRQEFVQKSGIPAGVAMLQAGQQQGFLRLFGADLPALEDAAPALDRILAEPHNASGGPAAIVDAEISHGPASRCRCQMGPGMQQQLHLLAVVLAARGELDPGGRVPEKFIAQAVKEVVMHEVGHTLGLRHNFKASTTLSLREVNNPEVTAKRGNSSSVMDYLPANIALKGEKQGDYFSPTIGAYDYWAIEYAYRPFESNEREELAKIAGRAAASELAYGTDEDCSRNPDPRINLFDLGDPLEYTESRVRLVRTAIDDLQNRVVAQGEGFQRVREAFAALLGELARATVFATGYIGGEYTCRDHRGDPGAHPQMQPIEIAKQRAAIRLLQEEILSARAFQFKPELLRQLAPSHWRDNVAAFPMSNEYRYPVLQRVLSIQRIVVARFLAAETLAAIEETGLHANPGQEVLQMAEVFDALTNSIWSELAATGDAAKKSPSLALPVVRRNLQREHVARLAGLVLGPRRDPHTSFLQAVYGNAGRAVPADARSLARQHLRRIDERITRVLGKTRDLDAAAEAHLEELHEQIAKVVKAALQAGDL